MIITIIYFNIIIKFTIFISNSAFIRRHYFIYNKFMNSYIIIT